MSEKLIETVVTKNDLKFALKHLGAKSSDAPILFVAAGYHFTGPIVLRHYFSVILPLS